jgi:hypothetical protein
VVGEEKPDLRAKELTRKVAYEKTPSGRENLEVIVDTDFWKNRSKGGKEKQPMRNRVQSADGRKGRMVNRIRRWSRKPKSIKWASESKRSAESQLEDQPMERKKLVTRKVRPKESMIETG